MHTLFISDLHLSPERPDLTQAFQRFLKQRAVYADALYILGDLFDFWIGDDDRSAFAQTIEASFQCLHEAGVPCYFIHGNRDFLVGKKFAQRAGISLLPEETVIHLYGRPVVLMHGDTLCLDDVRYLAFRAKVNQPWLRYLYRRLPFPIKKKLVQRIQGTAKAEKKGKALDIMDVTPSEVTRIMANHQVTMMIHGHTHRPQIHTDTHQQTIQTRVVLGDWDTDLFAFRYDVNGSYVLYREPIR